MLSLGQLRLGCSQPTSIPITLPHLPSPPANLKQLSSALTSPLQSFSLNRSCSKERNHNPKASQNAGGTTFPCSRRGPRCRRPAVSAERRQGVHWCSALCATRSADALRRRDPGRGVPVVTDLVLPHDGLAAIPLRLVDLALALLHLLPVAVLAVPQLFQAPPSLLFLLLAELLRRQRLQIIITDKHITRYIAAFGSHSKFPCINPLPPSDAVRKQKHLFLRIFSVQYSHNLKIITPLET